MQNDMDKTQFFVNTTNNGLKSIKRCDQRSNHGKISDDTEMA